MADVLLLDLSSLAHPLWHVSGKEPDPNWTSITALGKARALASKYAHVAVCCDQGRSFRKDISADYKANRPERNEALTHQVTLTREALAQDGYTVWGIDGYEADDIIATAARLAVERSLGVMIASSDKDLLQLVDDHADVKAVSLMTRVEYDEAGVKAKFGVAPCDMLTYLALVGDSSDNIKGVKGIGPKNAVKLIDAARDSQELALTDEQQTAYDAAVQLVMLRADAPIDFDQVLRERVPDNTHIEDAMTEPLTVTAHEEPAPAVAAATPEPKTVAVVMPDPTPAPTALVGWNQALEPRNVEDLRTMAKWATASRLFSSYGSPEEIAMITMSGREFGLGMTASLRGFHKVEGRPTMAADLIRGLALGSGKLEYLICTERSAERATWEGKRIGDPKATVLTYTLDEAKLAGLVKPNSGWAKHPADMVAKTASSKICRLLVPDVLFGIYAPEELGGEL